MDCRKIFHDSEADDDDLLASKIVAKDDFEKDFNGMEIYFQSSLVIAYINL